MSVVHCATVKAMIQLCAWLVFLWEKGKVLIYFSVKIGLQCIHVWLTSRFVTYNWNPVVFPVYRFGYNKIDSRTRLVDVSLTLNF